jgi:hypothetical protein
MNELLGASSLCSWLKFLLRALVRLFFVLGLIGGETP